VGLVLVLALVAVRIRARAQSSIGPNCGPIAPIVTLVGSIDFGTFQIAVYIGVFCSGVLVVVLVVFSGAHLYCHAGNFRSQFNQNTFVMPLG
jgi:hypothetical protein